MARCQRAKVCPKGLSVKTMLPDTVKHVSGVNAVFGNPSDSIRDGIVSPRTNFNSPGIVPKANNLYVWVELQTEFSATCGAK